ncbi:MAG: outer membrane beta-barrel protein [Muribaculaceae bacterium]|nr:outer membrane beta-barrel protein [Muribaculaceae bacterium]
MKNLVFSLLLVACGGMATQAAAQKFAVKASGDIGLMKAASITTALPGLSNKASSNSFGLDFGYTFWRRGASSLEVNVGVGYDMTSSSFEAQELNFNYAAPASADEDGNPYRRFTDIRNLKQKINVGYLKLPVYLQYQYRAAKWLGIHADVGVGFGFKCTGSVVSVTGTANSYGIYQEYNQLVIKADYLNDFGESHLAQITRGEADIKGFYASVMAGAGFEFYLAEPVSIDLGIRYNAGLTDVFVGRYDINSLSEITAETAPLTYTVSEGQKLKSFSDYVTKSRLSPLSLHLALNLRF